MLLLLLIEGHAISEGLRLLWLILFIDCVTTGVSCAGIPCLPILVAHLLRLFDHLVILCEHLPVIHFIQVLEDAHLYKGLEFYLSEFDDCPGKYSYEH